MSADVRGSRAAAQRPLPCLVVLLTALAALPGCRCDGGGGAGGTPLVPDPNIALPESPIPLDLGPPPPRRPLDPASLLIEGAPAPEAAGTIGGTPVPMAKLDSVSGGAFARIADVVYAAEDVGWGWLLERAALERLARGSELELAPYLRRQAAVLPAATDEQLDELAAFANLRELDPADVRLAATSLWRLRAWEIKRSVLVREGLRDVTARRLATDDPAPSAVVAEIDGRPVTRLELRQLAGYRAELSRREYWHTAGLQFERHASTFLLEAAAARAGVTAEELLRRERARQPPITDEEVRAFIAEAPEYASDPHGVERARDQVRRLREIRAREELERRLREEANVQFTLREPPFVTIDATPAAPRLHGRADAGHTLVVYHSLGCDVCARGSALVVQLARRYGDRLRILSADSFTKGRLGSYRGALALHCAAEQGQDLAWRLLERLTRDFGPGDLAEIGRRAEQEGLDRRRLEACMREDRYLADIVENVRLGERLGLDRNVPGLFLDGVRLSDLAVFGKVAKQVDALLAGTSN